MIKHLTSAALLAVIASPALSASISFEEFGDQPGTFVSQTNVLDTDYPGLTFSGGWEILNQSGNFGVDARSGSHFAAFNTNVVGISNTLMMTFDTAISSIGGWLGHGGAWDWTITAFLGDTEVLSTVESNARGEYVEFSLMGEFDKVSISSSGFAGVLEDLTYEPVSEVPLPAAGWMLLAGLGGLAATKRKRT